jgi:integrase
MSKPEFPKEVTKDSCTVTIYEREFSKPDKDGKDRDYVEYILAYYQNGKRKRETSADYLAIKARADEVLDDLAEGRPVEPGAIKAADRIDLNLANEILKPTGIGLINAVTHFAKAVEILGADLVIVAAQEYKKRNLTKIKPMLVSEVVDEFIADKERQKRSAIHVQHLESQLRRFAGSAVQSIATVTAGEIDMFLDGLQTGKRAVGPRTRDNFADAIVTLYKWAKMKRYVPSDYDETERITRLSNDEDGAIEIYSPEELTALLAKADAKLIPFLAIGAFSGLRSSEIMRLDWSDVRMDNGEPCIIVQKGKVKLRGKSRRIVPMSENLRAWLKPHAKKNGSVWPYSVPYLYEMLRELAPKAEALLRETEQKATLEWKANALRHSFISYRVASIKNVAQVALEAGNSPQMIFSNYRELVTEQDAAKWFSLSPA